MKILLCLLLYMACVSCAHPNPKRQGDQDPEPAVGRTQGSGEAYETDTTRDFSNPVRNVDSEPATPGE